MMHLLTNELIPLPSAHLKNAYSAFLASLHFTEPATFATSWRVAGWKPVAGIAIRKPHTRWGFLMAPLTGHGHYSRRVQTYEK